MHQRSKIHLRNAGITDPKIVKKSEELAKKDANRKQVKREYENCFQKFAKAVKYGPIFICACCHRKLFEQSVLVLDEAFREKLDEKHPDLFEMAVHDESADNGPNYKSDVELWNEVKVNKDFNDKGNHYITSVCKNYLLYGGFPSNSHKNKLDLTFIN